MNALSKNTMLTRVRRPQRCRVEILTRTQKNVFVILRWAKSMHLDLSTMPRLLAFKARMEARPGVQKALAAEGLH